MGGWVTLSDFVEGLESTSGASKSMGGWVTLPDFVAGLESTSGASKSILRVGHLA